MNFTKLTIILLIILVLINVCIYAFNHINAWLGIFGLIATVLLTINYIKSQIKKQQNQK